MKYCLLYISIAILFLMPLSAAGAGGKTDDVKGKTPEPVWHDIKKTPGPQVSEIPEIYNEVVKSFSDYWNALKEKDYKKAYEFESAAYRKSVSFDLYSERLKKAVEIIAVRPLEVKPISEKEVMVRASFGYKAGLLDTVRFIYEHWIKEDGGWKHLPDQESEEKLEEKKEEKK